MIYTVLQCDNFITKPQAKKLDTPCAALNKQHFRSVLSSLSGFHLNCGHTLGFS